MASRRSCHGGRERLACSPQQSSGCKIIPSSRRASSCTCAKPTSNATGWKPHLERRVRPIAGTGEADSGDADEPMDNDEMLKFATDLYVSKYREIATYRVLADGRRGARRCGNRRSSAKRCCGWKTRWPPGCGSSCRSLSASVSLEKRHACRRDGTRTRAIRHRELKRHSPAGREAMPEDAHSPCRAAL